MTTPNQARQRSSNGPRTYAWPPLPPHEFEVISVTSAKDAYPKPWLTGWAVKMTAECAWDDFDILAAFKKKAERGDTKAEAQALKMLKGARYSSSDQKANRGTVVHSALESYLAGRPLSKETVEAQLKEARVPPGMWKSTAAMIAGLMEFLHDEEPEVYWSESTVYSREHGYAGTPDLIARMRVGGSLVPVVIDVKTSKDIYDDTVLQTCAYARADFVGLDDGTEAPLLETGGPIDYGVVVRPTAAGKYEKAVFVHTDEVFEIFLDCLNLSRAEHRGVLRTTRRPS